MNPELTDEALEFGRTARRAIESAGGDRLAQMVEAAPADRDQLITPVFDELGAWDLNPRVVAEEAEAAAALCRNAGFWGLPYPLAERLSRPVDMGADGLVPVGGRRPQAAVAHTSLRWVSVDLAGKRSWATPRADRDPRHGAFVAELELEPIDAEGAADLVLALVLPCWTLLGMLDRAVQLTCDYVRDRHQFGQPLSSFQGVQFQLTDAEVERAGLEQLAKYALWAAISWPAEALPDALALRVAAIEAADSVFRVAHQLHGATGFCDETTLSWLSRYSQPLRRLPWGLSASQEHLAEVVGPDGLAGLFDEGTDVLLFPGHNL